MKPTSRLRYILPLLLFIVLFSMPSEAQDSDIGTLRNPLNAYGGADPWIQYYDGYYYMATTTWRSELLMWKSETLAGLKTAIPQQIYYETDSSRCCNMWAPEFYLLDGPNGLRWYFYYSAGTSGTLDNQRSHVLESEGTDPMGPYHYKARIFDPMNDVWSIDGSILQLDDELYFLFSSWVGAYQNIFIAPMRDPWTISGGRVLLSQSEYDWERVGLNVNEGAVALYHEDDVFIIYSASHCATADYKLGMLTYTGGDPLSRASWEKYPEPVFQQSPENGVYGSAHNGFFMSPDGSEYWIVYHANDTASGGCDDGRTTRVQSFTWNADGTPNFGVPVSTETVIAAPSGDTGVDPIPEFAAIPLIRFRSMSYSDGYLRHQDGFARVDVSPSPVGDSQFYVIDGLADADGISIRSINLPGHFLVHEGNAIVFAPNDGTDEFAASATWVMREGLADSEWVSLASFDREGYVIGQQFGIMALVEGTDTMSDVMREDATFLQEIFAE